MNRPVYQPGRIRGTGVGYGRHRVFTNREAFILSALVAIGIILATTLMFAAVEHQIHPDCSSVLACVRL